MIDKTLLSVVTSDFHLLGGRCHLMTSSKYEMNGLEMLN